MTNAEFEACIIRMKNGDKDGLKDIYEAYLPYIFRIILDILKNRANAEDVTSEFFIKLWEKADKFRPDSGHRAFISVMARNMAIDFLRKHDKEELTAMMQDLGQAPDGIYHAAPGAVDENPTEAAVIADMSLQAVLSTLGETERQVVGMKVLGELTFKEIAEILECPLGTITWRYQNAIKKLKDLSYV